jgi:hypothetical protein
MSGTLVKAPTSYNKESKTARRSSQRGIKIFPSSARLMEIMAKQMINREKTINVPDGWCTQTAEETLEELNIVHFPNSNVTGNPVETGSTAHGHAK